MFPDDLSSVIFDRCDPALIGRLSSLSSLTSLSIDLESKDRFNLDTFALIRNLSELTRLDLHGCIYYSDLEPMTSLFSQLESLSIRFAGDTDADGLNSSILSHINPVKITQLNLFYTSFDSQSFRIIQGFRRLRALHLFCF